MFYLKEYMFAEYFNTNRDKYQSSYQVDVDLEPTTELDAYHAADYGDDEAAEGYYRGSECKGVATCDKK